MRWLLPFFACCCLGTAQAQVAAVQLTVYIPQKLAGFQHVYVAGTFNNWKAGDEMYQMKQVDSLTYSLTLPVFRGQLYEYKYTIGKWNVVETDIRKQDVGNRSFTSKQRKLRVKDTVANWADPEKGKETNPMADRMNAVKDSLIQLLKPKFEILVSSLRSLIMNRLQDSPDEGLARQLTTQMRDALAQMHESIAGLMEKPLSRISPAQKKQLREQLAGTGRMEDFFQVFLSSMGTMMQPPAE